MAHLAHAAIANTDAGADISSEFGVSVLPHVRQRGFGRRLFEHAMLHARNRGVGTLLIFALSENIAMLKIARNAGATIVREGPEADARLKLPPDSFGSHLDELLEHGAAEWNYRLKVRAHQVGGLIQAIGEVRSELGKASHIAEG